jgi:hypothetical protein
MTVIPLREFPAINAGLNGASAIFLFTGYIFIRSRRILQHKICMLSAFTCSIVLLLSLLPFSRRSYPLRRRGLDSARVFYAAYFAHDSGCDDRPARGDDAQLCAAGEIWQPYENRALDVSVVALCVHHRRGHLLALVYRLYADWRACLMSTCFSFPLRTAHLSPVACHSPLLQVIY